MDRGSQGVRRTKVAARKSSRTARPRGKTKNRRAYNQMFLDKLGELSGQEQKLVPNKVLLDALA
jgi:hypothetical protein